jgi:hypothetical protein
VKLHLRAAQMVLMIEHRRRSNETDDVEHAHTPQPASA